MKSTDPHDRIDHQINELMASRPIAPSKDFTSRTVAAVNQKRTSSESRLVPKILRFSLPLAAAALIIFALIPPAPPLPDGRFLPESTAALQPSPVDDYHEAIFLLEEGLGGLNLQIDPEAPINSEALSQIFDTLYFGLQS